MNMAIVKMDLPKCDVCGEVWLPDKQIRDKSTNKVITNPARDNPRLCKRCGKCKTPTWNKNSSANRSQRKLHHRRTSANSGSVEPRNPGPVPNGAGLEKLYGILADEFAALGGGEAFMKAERDWGPDVWERYEQEEKARKVTRK
jgi:hypothetical protein